MIAERVLRLRMFDVQVLGALTMQRGHIAEMQTGKGKTLAAVPRRDLVRMSGSRHSRVDCQRLLGPAGREVDARDLRMVWTFCRPHLANHARRKAPSGLLL